MLFIVDGIINESVGFIIERNNGIYMYLYISIGI